MATDALVAATRGACGCGEMCAEDVVRGVLGALHPALRAALGAAGAAAGPALAEYVCAPPVRACVVATQDRALAHVCLSAAAGALAEDATAPWTEFDATLLRLALLAVALAVLWRGTLA